MGSGNGRERSQLIAPKGSREADAAEPRKAGRSAPPSLPVFSLLPAVQGPIGSVQQAWEFSLLPGPWPGLPEGAGWWPMGAEVPGGTP